jgi:hypothetical protein
MISTGHLEGSWGSKIQVMMGWTLREDGKN